MSASNRAKLISKLHTALKKHYKPLPAQPTRPLLEHVLYASLLEDAPHDLADEGMAKCEQEFFDWNEVRVTTVTELAQVLSRLPDAAKAARRLKSNLQAIFEEFYTFDLDHLKKENLGQAVAKFEKMPEMTPFVLSYTIQHGLGGHSIPVDYSAMVIMLATEIASQPEAMSGKVPGLERAIPKTKGIEFSGLLHQAAVDLNKNPKDKKARALLDQVNSGSSERLDQWLASKKAAKKRVVKRKTEEKAQAEADAETVEEVTAPKTAKKSKSTKGKAASNSQSASSSKSAAAKTPAPKSSSSSTKSASKTDSKSEEKTAKQSKKKGTKKAASSKSTTKKSSPKKNAATKSPTAKKSTKKPGSRKLSKRKPR